MWIEIVVFLLSAAFVALLLSGWVRSLPWIDRMLRRALRLDDEAMLSWGQSQGFLLLVMLALLFFAVAAARLLFAVMERLTA